MAHNYMLYLAFGNRDKNGLIKELICSLLSFQKVSSEATIANTQIVIYSSNPVSLPDSLRNLKVNFQPLTEQEIAESLKKNNGFNLALKVNVLHKFLKTISSGNVLFVDTDTYFIKDPYDLFVSITNGKFVMHLKEPKIHRRPVLKKYLANKNLKDIEGHNFKINPNIDIWNSGVIGIDHSFLPRVESLLYLLEQLTQDNNSHILEQLSFSFALQESREIIAADGFIVHYYFYKPFVHVLGRYFNFNINEDEETIQKLREENILPERIVYSDLPKILIRAIKNTFIEWHFYCLPRNSHIGKHLRRGFLYDKKYFIDVIRTFIKIMFKTYKLWEYNLNDKILKDRYSA